VEVAAARTKADSAVAVLDATHRDSGFGNLEFRAFVVDDVAGCELANGNNAGTGDKSSLALLLESKPGLEAGKLYPGKIPQQAK
jgi:hypothetical protein